jgi:hypothetical protein
MRPLRRHKPSCRQRSLQGPELGRIAEYSSLSSLIIRHRPFWSLVLEFILHNCKNNMVLKITSEGWLATAPTTVSEKATKAIYAPCRRGSKGYNETEQNWMASKRTQATDGAHSTQTLQASKRKKNVCGVFRRTT